MTSVLEVFLEGNRVLINVLIPIFVQNTLAAALVINKKSQKAITISLININHPIGQNHSRMLFLCAPVNHDMKTINLNNRKHLINPLI